MDGLPGPAIAALLATLNDGAATNLLKCGHGVRANIWRHGPPFQLQWSLPSWESPSSGSMIGACSNVRKLVVLGRQNPLSGDDLRQLAAVLRGALPPCVEAMTLKVG